MRTSNPKLHSYHGLRRLASGRSHQTIADAANRLQEEWIGGIALDLAPQAVDLHVDRALIDTTVAGQRAARHGFSRSRREDAQHVTLAVGQMDDLLALAQFAAGEVIDVWTEGDLLQRLSRRRRRGTLEDVADPQRKLARLEGFCDIVIGADLQPLNARLSLVSRRQHHDGDRGGLADEAGEVEAGFAGHHDVENQQVEMQAGEFGAGVAGVERGGDAIAFAAQKARQEIADAPVVIDQQQMRGVVRGLLRRRQDGSGERHSHSFFGLEVRKIVSSTLSGSSRSIIARRKPRTTSTLEAPISASARLMRAVCRPASFASSASPLAVA